MPCRIYSFSQRTRNLIVSKWKNMQIYAKIMNKYDGCIIERCFVEFCVQKTLKELKATIYGWTIKVFTNFVHEALEILTVVSSMDCCLLAASLSRAGSFSSTTNRFFLRDVGANNFVPGKNCCECNYVLWTGLALSGVMASDTFLFPESLETLTFIRCRN